MGYKPTTLVLKAPIAASEEDFWQVMLELDADGPWTVGDVVGRTRTQGGTISGYCRRLRLGGFIAAEGSRPHPRGGKHGPATTYRVARPVALAPRLNEQGSPRAEPQIETIWRTMKMHRAFTAKEIARAVVEGGDKPDPVRTVRAYLLQLQRVDIVAMVSGPRGKAGGGTTEARYRILRNVGARAPRILASRIVYDPNSQTAIGTAEVQS